MKKRLFALACALLCVLAPMARAEEHSVAYPATRVILVNGEEVELQAYALEDERGYRTNYVKIRDMAVVLENTTARFEVGWDNGVNIETGKAYRSRNGQEGQAPYSGEMPYTYAVTPTKVDGAEVEVDAFVLTDSDGNGSTYYKLRDLGRALDFHVFWSQEEGVWIDTSISYQEE